MGREQPHPLIHARKLLVVKRDGQAWSRFWSFLLTMTTLEVSRRAVAEAERVAQGFLDG